MSSLIQISFRLPVSALALAGLVLSAYSSAPAQASDLETYCWYGADHQVSCGVDLHHDCATEPLQKADRKSGHLREHIASLVPAGFALEEGENLVVPQHLQLQVSAEQFAALRERFSENARSPLVWLDTETWAATDANASQAWQAFRADLDGVKEVAAHHPGDLWVQWASAKLSAEYYSNCKWHRDCPPLLRTSLVEKRESDELARSEAVLKKIFEGARPRLAAISCSIDALQLAVARQKETETLLAKTNRGNKRSLANAQTGTKSRASGT